MHAYLSYATQPWDEDSRTQLTSALQTCPADVDITAVHKECTELLGNWSSDPLPLTIADIPTQS